MGAEISSLPGKVVDANARGRPLVSGGFATVSARQIAYGALMVLAVACSREAADIPSATSVSMHAEFGAADQSREHR